MEKTGEKNHDENKIAPTGRSTKGWMVNGCNFFFGRYARSPHGTGPEEKLPHIRNDVDQQKSFLALLLPGRGASSPSRMSPKMLCSAAAGAREGPGTDLERGAFPWCTGANGQDRSYSNKATW